MSKRGPARKYSMQTDLASLIFTKECRKFIFVLPIEQLQRINGWSEQNNVVGVLENTHTSKPIPHVVRITSST
jgi:hypothetical protein